ncbi:hypothetical protein CAI16_15090 [Virgibacillus dokdonensis]|uniref:DUF6792 domain-containing protein n=1 Tax=Virgibacillus dokdonensis TaxID=302167 RepID=A0A3E0WMY2_9BACI|nr:hypothetical protein CAI16_15090 [Virgibacillus dokdonensis]
MFAGKDGSQAIATNKFVNEAKKEFGVADTIPTTGLSHSLAHNNNTTAHLVFDIFDEVYSVNGAQTNYYQLYFTDIGFANAVRSHFSLSLSEKDHSAIYDIDPNQLRQFAENHYKDKRK